MKKIIRYSILILFTGYISFISCKKERSCEGCASNSTVNINKPPTSIAGLDQTITLPTDSVSLNGSSSSDPDGIISEWLWTKISGPASFTIIKPADSITKVKALVTGTYLFELKVTDNGGLSAKDTMRVIIDAVFSPTNHPPIANAGADQTITLPTNAITLDGSVSTDSENNITSYAWTKISGPSSSNITNANNVQTQVTNLVQGVYQFELKVTDAGGLFSKDTLQITVNALSNTFPTTNIGDIIITLPLDSVYLDGMAYVGTNNFQWNFISGPAGSTINNSNILYPGLAIVKGLTSGLYTFRLEVNSPTGMFTYTITVLVIDDPQNLNTITFKKLKWRLADEYGTGIIDVDIVTPAQPNLFIAWDQLRPVQIYLQQDSLSQWFSVSSTQSGIMYNYDAARPHIWIARIPRDDSWVGKESSIKIKLL